MVTSYKLQYPVSTVQYAQLVAECDSRCSMCRIQAARLYVDHDHVTNLVRGLLCASCNTWLGAHGDSVEGLCRWFLDKVTRGFEVSQEDSVRFLEAIEHLVVS